VNLTARQIRHLAGALAGQGVTPGKQYCGAPGCLHPGSVHASMGNRCLVCTCPSFSTQDPTEDLVIAVRIAVEGVLS